MQLHSERGTAMVEFVIVTPMFLFIIFMMLELSLMWVDKHYLRYALFDAGRILSTSELADPCKDTRVFNQSRFRAAVRMAAVAPPIERISEFLPGGPPAESTPSQAPQNGGLAKMLWYVAKRLPGSLLTLQLKCSYDAQDPHSFKLSARYLRLVRMPMVGRVLSIASQSGLNDESVGQSSAVLSSWLSQPLFQSILREHKWSTSATQLATQFTQMSANLNRLPAIVPINLSWRFEVFSHRAQPETWQDGKALAVAPFNPQGFGEGWRLWSRQLSRKTH